MKNYLWHTLGWILGLSVSLILIGLLIQDIPQPLDTIKWLIHRRGYPYFQAITLSILVVASAIVFPDFIDFFKEIVEDKQVHWSIRWIIRVLLIFLPSKSPEQKSSSTWRILLGFSIVCIILSISFQRCLTPDAILISFDILEDGALVAHILPNATVSVNPGSYIEIEAKLESSLLNLAPPPIKCEWTTYTGDGRLIQTTNCKINYQTGIDVNPDPVIVNITQKSCTSSLGYFSFFISNAP